MIFTNRRPLLCCLLLWCLGAGMAHAELMQRIQSGIDGVARGMDYMGRRTGQLLGPGLPISGETAAAFEYRRISEEQYPAGATPLLALSNEFGEVRINTWNERIVRISAEIVVAADSEATAEQVAHLIEIRTAHGEDYLECHTIYPEIKSSGQITVSVNYDISVPRDAGVAVDNFFGDVHLHGIGGMVVADVQYGGLTLTQIQGATRARVQGDFPVHVNGLKQGGVFTLQGADAAFGNVHGELEINQFRGRVRIQHIGEEARLAINSDNGKAVIVLAPDASPDLTAVVVYGKFESALDATRTLRGAQLTARRPDAEARQHITINAAFSEIGIVIEGAASEAGALAQSETKVFNDARHKSLPTHTEEAVHIRTIAGNIQILGADTEELAVEATRVVWTPSAAAALDALDAIEVDISSSDGVIRIQTRVTQDMSIFDCAAYRVDLRIECPRELALHIFAEDGVTAVEGTGAGAFIQQNKGEVLVNHVKGSVNISNNNGAVTVRDCSGPIEATTQYGSLTIENIYGSVRTHATEGHTYVDAPRGELHIRHKSGDVRVLSLEPIQGNFDIHVEDGNLNVFLAPESDASVNVKAVQGQVQSSLPLSGAINRDFQEFFGRFNNETHTVRLESLNGDIFLN